VKEGARSTALGEKPSVLAVLPNTTAYFRSTACVGSFFLKMLGSLK